MSELSGGQSPEQRLDSARSWAERTPLSGTSLGPSGTTRVTDRLQVVIDAAERAAEAIRYDAEEQARRHLADAQHRADQMTAERIRVISQLTDDLIEHASTVKQHSEQMVGTLERAITTVAGRLEEVRPTESIPSPDPILEPPPHPPTPHRPNPSGDETQAVPTPTLDAALGIDRPTRERSSPEAADSSPGPTESTHSSSESSMAEPSRSERSPADARQGEPPPDAILRATQLAIAGEGRESIERAIETEFGVDPGPVLDRVPGV